MMSHHSDHDASDHKNAAKGTEVFVGGLSPSVTETKIREVFSSCGEIIEVRMIMDHKGNSKGYCFVRFSTRDAAVKAVEDKAGIKLEGRKIGVLPSAEQNSLFIGNLPKDWSSDEFDRVVRTVFQDVVSVNLAMPLRGGGPPTKKPQNRGFGFVQFSTHAAAARAYRMGSRSDFILVGKCHPTVEWAEEEPEIDPEELSKVKIAFVRDLPVDVNEDFLKKLFGRFGEIEKVVLSKKSQSQVGFVHFAKRSDLDNAVKEMHERTVQGTSAGSFKLQVEVARPFEKSKKRAREGSSRSTGNIASQHKILKAEPAFASSGGHVLNILEEPVATDIYETTVVSLPVAIKDRLLRILRLGIATRYDIDMQSLRSLKEIPESAAISVLDQFLLSGGDEIDKGTFLYRLIAKARSPGTNRLYEYTSRASDIANVRSDLVRLSSRSQLPVVEFPSRVTTSASRYDTYSPRLSYMDYSLSPSAGITRPVEERKASPIHLVGSSPAYVRMGINSSVAVRASHESTRSQVRFDPFTGEPYKFDPFTGEPIQPGFVPNSNESQFHTGSISRNSGGQFYPGSISRSSGSLY